MAGSTYTYRITAEGVDAVKAAFGSLQSKLLEFAGIGGLGFMIDNSLKMATSIDTMSRQAAMSTADFQEWSYALQQFNVSQESAAAGMKIFAQNSAQFVKQNSGPAKKAFGVLGMSAGGCSAGDEGSVGILRADPSEDWRGEKRGGAGRPRQAAFWPDLMQAPSSVEPIQAGITALQQYREEAERLGIVFSQDHDRRARERLKSRSTISKPSCTTSWRSPSTKTPTKSHTWRRSALMHCRLS